MTTFVPVLALICFFLGLYIILQAVKVGSKIDNEKRHFGTDEEKTRECNRITLTKKNIKIGGIAIFVGFTLMVIYNFFLGNA